MATMASSRGEFAFLQHENTVLGGGPVFVDDEGTRDNERTRPSVNRLCRNESSGVCVFFTLERSFYLPVDIQHTQFSQKHDTEILHCSKQSRQCKDREKNETKTHISIITFTF